MRWYLRLVIVGFAVSYFGLGLIQLQLQGPAQPFFVGSACLLALSGLHYIVRA